LKKTKHQTESERWRRSPELLPDAFAAYAKTDGQLNPSSVVATIDEDGSPRIAPFGSLRAVNPRLLRLLIGRYHDTLANIKRDSRTMIAMICPPNVAVSVRGRARVVEEPFSLDEGYALVEVDIEEVKNDMPIRVGLKTGIAVAPNGPFVDWWKSLWEKMGAEENGGPMEI